LQRFRSGKPKDVTSVPIPDTLDLSNYIHPTFCAVPVPFRYLKHAVLAKGQKLTDPGKKKPLELYPYSVDEDEELKKITRAVNAKYVLEMLLLHDGPSIEGGHFSMAYREDEGWTTIDDEKVSRGPIDPASVYLAVYKHITL
jgi:hypothetical protein